MSYHGLAVKPDFSNLAIRYLLATKVDLTKSDVMAVSLSPTNQRKKRGDEGLPCRHILQIGFYRTENIALTFKSHYACYAVNQHSKILLRHDELFLWITSTAGVGWHY